MEFFPITKTSEGLRIEGLPETAVKTIKLTGPQAKRLADLFLHRRDLEFALRCLRNINEVGCTPDRGFVQQALWRSAIVHFGKCFGSNRSRSSLTAQQVYKGDAQAIEVYNHFKALRNKHVAHDDNAFMQGLPGAVLSDGSLDYKIEKIVCLSMTANTLTEANHNNLHVLSTRAHAWVTQEFDQLCERLTSELEAFSYEELLAREGMEFTAVGMEAVGTKRTTP